MDIETLNLPALKIKQFHRVGISTLEDLLMYLPRKYMYYGAVTPFEDFPKNIGKSISICGTVSSVSTNFKNVVRVTAVLKSNSGKFINAVWFNQRYISNYVYEGMFVLVHGKLSYNEKYKSYSIVPDYFCADLNSFNDIVPVYKKIPGMSSDYLKSCIKTVMETMDYGSFFPENHHMDDDLANRVGICDFKSMLQMAHFPKTMEDCDKVERWKTADLLSAFAAEMVAKKIAAQKDAKYPFNSDAADNAKEEVKGYLPYTLTKDQEKAIEDMEQILCSGKRLNALLQGDVGCGKSIVAFMLAVMAVKSGFQAAIMAPTYVLAEQHFHDLKSLLDGTGIQIDFLHSGLKAKERKAILKRIKEKETSIVVGTHAVLSEDVQFHSLAITIVDEEHRFGVKQRERLIQKAAEGTHTVSMSATPIPRTLALATIGNEVVIENIKTMPAGRLPVTTVVFSNAEKTYEAMRRQVLQKHQCYMICPLIHESESEKMAGVMSVEEAYSEMQTYYDTVYGPDNGVRIAAITGKMKPGEVQARIDAFKQGDIDILLSTTIVEVGVNVPNATVMVIRNAERFGLAQLHQLRGRVGRGAVQSYCVLLSNDKGNERLQAMTKTTDGFEIAEEDMKLRGSGNLVGVEQSGYDKCVTAMLQNQELYGKLYSEIEKIAKASHQYAMLHSIADKRYGREV